MPVAHSIAAVARITDLSPDVIRSWERRYKFVEPARDASGVRLYSDREVARLALGREATRLGHPIRRVAQLTDAQLEELIDRSPPPASPAAGVVSNLLGAINVNDLAGASQILRAAAMLMPERELVLEVLAPALREAGDRWERGELAVWQEHFLSNQVLNVAGPLQRSAPERARVVFGTPPFERHGLGIALASQLAGARGVATCNLGVTVPADELIAAARELGAAAVVVGMTRDAAPEREAIEYARALHDGLPAPIDLVLGGTAGARVAQAVASPHVRGVATLEEFDGLCLRWR